MKTSSFHFLSIAFLLGVVFTLCSTGPALASTAYNNFGPGDDGWEYNWEESWLIAGVASGFEYVEQAHAFTPDESGNLLDIYLGMGKVINLNQCTIKLAPDTGTPPTDDDVLESWVLNDLPPYWLGEVVQIESVEQPYLTAGQDYYIWITVDLGSSAAWGKNVTNSMGHMMQYVYDSSQGYHWEDCGYSLLGAMRIDVLSGPAPDIKANGQDDPLTLDYGSNLTVDLSLNPGAEAGNNADWWLVVSSPFGWYYYNLETGNWSPGFEATYQGRLAEIGPLTAYNGSALPVGTYDFYFGVDMNMNGVLDTEEIYYDRVSVTVQKLRLRE